MKIKCVKAECPVCKVTGSIQLFLNRSGEIRYARTRHYSHIDKVSKKPQFTYCKINDLEALQTLIKSQSISLNTEEVTAGQVGHGRGFVSLDPQLGGCATVHQTGQRASSSVRIEHQPQGKVISLGFLFFVLLFLPSFSHHWSNVFTLAASIYPVRVSKKILLGLYFSRFLAFITFITTFLSRRRAIEEATINLPRRRVLGTEGIEILWRVREPEIPPLDFLRTVA